MPTYVYECAKCGEEVEAWQSFTEAPLKKHAGCGGKLTKVLQPVGIVFKGSGFHRTDSRNGGKRGRSDTTPDKTDADKSSDKAGDSSTSDTLAAKPAKKSSEKSSGKTPASTTSSTASNAAK